MLQNTCPPRSYSLSLSGSSTVWVGSLPNAISDDEFYDIMSRYGEVEGMKLVALKGFAYVK